MRAAYICSDRGIPVFGCKGSSLHVQEVVRAMEHFEIQTDLFAATIGGDAPSDIKTVNTYRTKRLKATDLAVKEQADIDANQTVTEALEASGPYDFVYERYSLWSHAGMSYARAAGIPAILEVNSPLIEEQKKYRGLINADAAENITRKAMNAATTIIAVSQEVASYLEGIDEARSKVRVIPNGVNIAKFSIRSRRVLTEADPFTVGFIGTLKPWHGVEYLIEAFAELYRQRPQARLLLVGDGPMFEALSDRVAKLGLTDVVEMTGAVNPAEVPKIYNNMDVGVAPYPGDIDFYFSPLKVYEYMAAGLPVVASDIGQIGKIIDHNSSGLLCQAGNTDSLMSALRTLLDDRQLSRRMGEQARQNAVREHSWDNRVANILDVSGILQPDQESMEMS